MDDKAQTSHLEEGQIPKLGALGAMDLASELEALDKDMESKIRWKYDMRVVPIMSLIYLMAFIDRSNMGNAKIMGMEKDLALVGLDFNIALTGFFITYVIFEVPANILCKKFGPRIWLTLITFIFGVITMSIAFVTSHTGLVIARVVLGVSEAGIMPGIVYALGTFYRRHELVTRVGFYASFASLAGAFGGLLAIGFSQVPQFGMVHSWRAIFFFEGVLTMVAAGICYAFLPDSPGVAKFLTEEERELGVRRIFLETLSTGKEKLGWHHMKRSVFNLNTWLMSVGLFCSLLCMNSVALFMPSLLKAMGYTSIRAQLMTVPPYVVGSIVCITCAIISDRMKTRGGILVGIAAPTIVIGFAILLTVDTTSIKYFALFLSTMGAFTASPIILAWTVDNSAGPTIRAIAGAFAVCLGTSGGLVATWTYLPTAAPKYTTGHIINMASGCLLLTTMVISTVYLRWENRQRDHGKRDHRLEGLNEAEINNLGHSHPAFRYTP